jgi:light-harvesting protein B-800-850 alpha chain
MNPSRIWLYVSPTVGLPLFWLAFITASLLVHASLLYNTTWMAGFWQGNYSANQAQLVAAHMAPAMPMAPAEAPAP